MPKVLVPPTKVLFEFKGWDVRETRESTGLSAVCHIPCDWWTYYGIVKKQCPYCGQQIPDEVYGVWALHNWDNLHDVFGVYK